jgi:hypothetical protein
MALLCLLHELVDIDAAMRWGDTPAGQLVIPDRKMLAEVNFLMLEPKWLGTNAMPMLARRVGVYITYS